MTNESDRQEVPDVCNRAGSDGIPPDGEDCFIDRGLIVVTSRGREIVSNCVKLVSAAMPYISDICKTTVSLSGGYFQSNSDIARRDAYLQFCLSCMYTPIRSRYTTAETSLFMDAIFKEFYGRLPKGDEPYQEYLKKWPVVDRIKQFVVDVLGDHLRGLPEENTLNRVGCGNPFAVPTVSLYLLILPLMTNVKEIVDVPNLERDRLSKLQLNVGWRLSDDDQTFDQDSTDQDTRETEAGRLFSVDEKNWHADGQGYLRRMYANNSGALKDETKVAGLSSNKSDRWWYADALLSVGLAYANTPDMKDEDEAIYWFRMAAELGHAEAQYLLADCIPFFDNEASEATDWLLKSAEQGYVDAQFTLGKNYIFGFGVVEKDETEGARWLRKAAEQGDAHSQYNLAWMYVDGQGVAKDEAEAAHWLSKAAHGYRIKQKGFVHYIRNRPQWPRRRDTPVSAQSSDMSVASYEMSPEERHQIEAAMYLAREIDRQAAQQLESKTGKPSRHSLRIYEELTPSQVESVCNEFKRLQEITKDPV